MEPGQVYIKHYKGSLLAEVMGLYMTISPSALGTVDHGYISTLSGNLKCLFGLELVGPSCCLHSTTVSSTSTTGIACFYFLGSTFFGAGFK